MPELPEVETTLRGIQPHIQNQKISNVVIRHSHLRFPIPANLKKILMGQRINILKRRAKYLLLECDNGTLILHLGMSGSLRIVTTKVPPQKHDHVDIEFANKKILRFRDPRRFGALLWTTCPLQHPLIRSLGVEPLEKKFTGNYLFERARNRKVGIKAFLMNNNIVVGIGNIYATEALFAAKIHPLTPVNKISTQQFNQLVSELKSLLRKSIKQGGTTLKDFVKSDGKPGYFVHFLKIYGHSGLPCPVCKTTLASLKISQRTTVFCPGCQTLP